MPLQRIALRAALACALLAHPLLAGVAVRVSQGTLAIAASPFVQAPQSTSLTIRVIC